MEIQSFVDFMEERFSRQIASRSVLEPSTGEFEPIPSELNERLSKALQKTRVVFGKELVEATKFLCSPLLADTMSESMPIAGKS